MIILDQRTNNKHEGGTCIKINPSAVQPIKPISNIPKDKPQPQQKPQTKSTNSGSRIDVKI